MLHCVRPLVANFVCLLFGDEQVVYSGYLLLKTTLWQRRDWTETDAGRKNQNNLLKYDETSVKVKTADPLLL